MNTKQTISLKLNPSSLVKKLGFSFLILSALTSNAQKKPLDHTVYDQWQSIGIREFSPNGQWLFYQVNPQEGDKQLIITKSDKSKELLVSRGENPVFTGTSNFVVFSIRPSFADLKAVKVKKKKEDEIAKDSLGIFNLITGDLVKKSNIKSFKVPKKKSDYLAYLLQKEKDTVKSKEKSKAKVDADTPLDLVLENMKTNEQLTFRNVTDYYFDDQGQSLVFVTKDPASKKKKKEEEDIERQTTDEDLALVKAEKDTVQAYGVYAVNLKNKVVASLLEGKGKYTQFSFDENGKQLVFLGNEEDEKALVKKYTMYYSNLVKPLKKIATDSINGMPEKWVLSENYKPVFSKNGKRLYLGIAPQPVAKDTTLIVDDHANVDVWHYNEDYIQPYQLANLDKELKRSYLATIDLQNPNKLVALANKNINSSQLVDQGNSNLVFNRSDFGRRVEKQWDISGVYSYYTVDVNTGKQTEVIADLPGSARISPKGNFVVYYNSVEKNWYSYSVKTKVSKLLNKNIAVAFADEEFDMPDHASEYGIQGWSDNDESVLIRDRFDIWEFFLEANKAPRLVTNGYGRKHNIAFDLLNLDAEKKSYSRKVELILAAFNQKTKEAGLFTTSIQSVKNPNEISMKGYSGYSSLFKAKEAKVYGYVVGSFEIAPNLFVAHDLKHPVQISNINLQQKEYNWGTSELVYWTTPNGYDATGVLYKPEDFDATKSYPMIVYFYEKLSDNVHRYEAPAPTPSRLNISYFVSNGYLVFTPDVSYIDGYPGKSAEEYINSGVEYLKHNTWVNGAKIAIQGQSWGGYQVAHLITVTDMYAAAWTGAPVVNMTSAYGGIRWQSGMSRQFQYEKTQSRIGQTLWDAHDLYIENSPLFAMPNVKTPVVIMHNDNDGAVPWYQGIEMFMALRRLGKPAWMLNYNGDEHNLMKRQNRKDIQIRQQQFFDYYLKDGKAPVWMTKGVPATMKGKDWGFDLTDDQIQ